jgi:hypothetical protein
MNLTIELPDEQNAALAAKARAKGLSAEQYARQVLQQDLEAPGPPRRHISEVITERMKRVPAAVFERLPVDGASEHDHYIYGLPKRNL